MTLPDPSRVPGAEPLSAVEANLAEIHRLADTGSLWLGMVAAPSAALREGRVQIRSLAREALEALRAERTAAPASGEVRERLEHAIALVLGLSLAAERGQRRALTNGELDGLLEILNQAQAALASSLTPQPDVEALKRLHDLQERIAALTNLFPGPADPELSAIEYLEQSIRAGVSAALARVPPAPQPVAEPIAVSTQIPLSAVMTALSAVPPAPAAQAPADAPKCGVCAGHGMFFTTRGESAVCHDCKGTGLAAQARSAGRVEDDKC